MALYTTIYSIWVTINKKNSELYIERDCVNLGHRHNKHKASKKYTLITPCGELLYI